MPYGKPFTDRERRERHRKRFGNLDDFSEKRIGKGRFWKEKGINEEEMEEDSFNEKPKIERKLAKRMWA